MWLLVLCYVTWCNAMPCDVLSCDELASVGSKWLCDVVIWNMTWSSVLQNTSSTSQCYKVLASTTPVRFCTTTYYSSTTSTTPLLFRTTQYYKYLYSVFQILRLPPKKTVMIDPRRIWNNVVSWRFRTKKHQRKKRKSPQQLTTFQRAPFECRVCNRIGEIFHVRTLHCTDLNCSK